MVRFIICCLLLFSVCSCNRSADRSLLSQGFDITRIADDQFSVIILQDGKVSAGEAKRLARVKAAEVTVQNGYQYFIIQSETPVQVSQTMNGAQFSGNLYQEVIIENNPSKGLPSSITYQGLKIVFQCYQVKPNRQAIDACTLTPCN